MPLQGRVDVGHEDPHENGGGQHDDQQDGSQDNTDGPPDAAALSGFFPCSGALLCLFGLMVFVHGQGTFLSLLLEYMRRTCGGR
jgi:ABC-type nickel/cobalt efflux system permease component RcnA